MTEKIYLSPPHMSGKEIEFVKEAFDTNWIAPLGPHVNAFEKEFAKKVGARHAAALSSGTAALHLALIMLGVGQGDEVICSSLTFAASANAVVYQGAKPVFIDCEKQSWNMDPALLEQELASMDKKGKLPKAVVVVHLYGQSADLDPIALLCEKYGVPLVEDAAECLGATYKGRHPGTFGKCGVFSFNGNKIITTSGGGMLVSDDEKMIERARFLATQARDPAPHYEHSTIGYNYRMSNILAGVGRGQLMVLDQRVERKREIFDYYVNKLGDEPGIDFMPEASYGKCTRWLTCLTVDPEKYGADRERIRAAMEAENIEARPVWKPMHLQPVFKDCRIRGGPVSEDLFARGLCLPSGTNLSEKQLERIVSIFLEVKKR